MSTQSNAKYGLLVRTPAVAVDLPTPADTPYIPYAILPHITGHKPTSYGVPRLPPRKVGYVRIGLPLKDSHIVETLFVGDFVFLVGQVAAEPVYWLVDTSTPELLINQRYQTLHAKLPPSPSGEFGAVVMAGFRVFTEDGYAVEFPPTTAVVRDLNTFLLNLINAEAQPGIGLESFGGVIGAKLLHQVVAEIDWPLAALTFHPTVHKPIGDVLPMTMTPLGQITIPVQVGTHPIGPWIVDTANRDSILSSSFVHRYGIPAEPPLFGVRSASGQAVQVGRTAGQLWLGGKIKTLMIYLGVPLAELADYTRSVDGILGTDVMRFFAISFDYGRGQLTIRY